MAIWSTSAARFTSPHRYGRSSICTTSKITITSETSLIQERYWASDGIYRSANGPWAVLSTWYPKAAYTGNREMNVLKIPGKFPPPRIYDLSHFIHGCPTSLTLDLTRSYHQMPVAPEVATKSSSVCKNLWSCPFAIDQTSRRFVFWFPDRWRFNCIDERRRLITNNSLFRATDQSLIIQVCECWYMAWLSIIIAVFLTFETK